MQRMIEHTGILQRTGVFGSMFLLLILFMQGVPALALTPIVDVQGIEVTQAVQSMSETDKSLNNSVPLIANKKTVVRVYFTRTSGNSVTITANLLLKRPDASTKLVNPSKLHSSLTNTLTVTSNAMLTPKREDLKKSLNFFLPDSWTAAGQLKLSIAQVKKNGSTIQCSNCGATSQIQVIFEPAPPFRLALIGLSYKIGTAKYQPRELDFVRIRSWLRRAYPTATVENLQLVSSLEEFRIIPYDTSLDTDSENLFTTDGCMLANKQLHAIRNLEIVGDSNVAALTHYYGIVYYGGAFMQGCPLGFSLSSTSEGPSPASGPTGLPSRVSRWKWDKDKSFGDWYAGHELGHTRGRLHSFVCSSQCAQDPAHGDCAYLSNTYPYQDGQLSNSGILNTPYFVGLDIGDDGPITTSSGTKISRVPPKVYPGISSHDVMTTKCENIWISDHTYKGILQRLREEDAVEDITAAIPAELLVTGSARHPNLRLVNDVINARTLDQGRTEAAQGEPEQEPPVKKRSKVQVQSGNFLNVIGDVNLTKGTGRISYVNPVSWATVRPTTSDRTVVLRVTEANETVNEYPVSVQVHPSHGKGSEEKGIVDAIIPRVTNIEQLDLVLHNTPVATRRAKAGAPQVKNIHLEERKAPAASNPSQQRPRPHPPAPSGRLSERDKSIGSNSGESKAVESAQKSELPTFRIQRHSDGYTVVTWEATDPDGDSLTFSVQVSNNGKIWRTYAIGLQGNELVLSEAQLKSLKELYVKVIVSDGLNGTAFISEPLSPLGSR